MIAIQIARVGCLYEGSVTEIKEAVNMGVVRFGGNIPWNFSFVLMNVVDFKSTTKPHHL